MNITKILNATRHFTLPFAFSLLVATSMTTTARAANCPVNYADFEDGVPHVDIETCPTKFRITPEEGFCRLALTPKRAIIYVFKFTDANACLANIKTMPLADFLYKG